MVSIRMVMRMTPGISDVQGDWDEKTVTVEYDDAATDLNQIKEALVQAGYPDEGPVVND